MADYLTRVAEAVRDATLNKAWQIGNNGPLRSAVDLQAVIASVPRPEPVATMVPAGAKVWFSYDGDSGFDVHNTAEEARQTAQQAIDEYRDDADPDDGWPEQVENVCWGVVLDKTREVEIHDGYDGSAGLADCGRPVDYVLASEPVAAQLAIPGGWKLVPPEAPQTIQCNACDWIGSSADAHYLGGRGWLGPLCPECGETTGPADGAATLRSAIRAMAAMLQAREWAEHVSTDPDVTDLEAQITELVGTATKLREQNAALVAALEHLEHNARSSGAEMGLALDVARAALASAKGGAQ